MVHDLTVLVAACYTVRCAVEVNRQLAQIERPLVAGPYVLQHVHQRFVCLRSPSAMVFLFQGSEASTIHGNRPSEQTLLDWQCNLDVALVPARDISDGRLHSGFSRCSQGGCCGNPENPEERHWSSVGRKFWKVGRHAVQKATSKAAKVT